ncbi:hypothetical protein STSP_21520 [Streptomyces jeddahensis]|uniref:Uncharacterized protein n=1 Tax=Streptomyces jeddahensis TaxID=1716141 RepID=A0A177HUJ7_9ACTN|nr:hypothetical protein STSP_21520 [Streptomyces jeddahensis]
MLNSPTEALSHTATDFQTAVHRCCGRLAGAGRRADGTAYGPSAVFLAVVTALVCAALAAATGSRPEFGVWLLLAPVGVLLAAVDHRVHRMPDVLTLPLAGPATGFCVLF